MKGSLSFRNQCAFRQLQVFLVIINFLGASARSLQECNSFAPPATIKGNKIFVSSTGRYLPIKGINYYPRPNDGNLTLGNSQDFYTEDFRSSWERDIAQFQALGLNAIRLYAVDPGQNHDAFMCALKAAGIYVLVGLAADCQNCAVQWQDPPLCYPQSLRARGEFIIQQFAKYENILGFDAGNEVSLGAASYLGNLPCQKKFIRDMRAFVQQCTDSGGMRHIPVGLAIADHERAIQFQYYNCRSNTEDELENAEFLGINTYLHCDGTVTNIDDLVGFKTLLADVASWGMTIPVMWTEFGCLNPSFPQQGEYQAQRDFLQVAALFSPEYREHFNGGFVFEYSTEKVYSEESSPFPFTTFGAGNYGVGYFSPESCNGQDIPCEYIPFPQFETLAARYSAVDVTDELTLETYNPPALDPPLCPDIVPILSAFDWPTDFDISSTRTVQCPALVPVYCAGIPGECTTVPPAGDEEIAVPNMTAADLVTISMVSISNVSDDTVSPAKTSTNSSSSMEPSQMASAAPSLRPSREPTAMLNTTSPTQGLTSVSPSFNPTTVDSQAPTAFATTSETTSQNPTYLPSTNQTTSPTSAPVATEGEETLLPSDATTWTRPSAIASATLLLGLMFL